MSRKELRIAPLILRVIAGSMTAADAAAALGMTDRNVRYLKSRVEKGGIKALTHKSRGKPGNRRMSQKERSAMEKLILEKYPDFGPTFASEKLREEHGIVRDPKTVRNAMIGLGLWKPDKKKASEHRLWRERRARYGELMQYDGSYEHWFEDRNGTGEVCLLAAIDDATGNIVEASFAEHEGVLPTMGFWRGYAEKHGLPRSVYLDKFSTYKMHVKIAAENPDTKTQFSRATEELGIRLVFANSPQAKGRVERLFKTLQDRLIKELRLRNISTVEAANRFLKKKFIPDFNRRFGRSARENGDAHRPLSMEEKRRLGNVFCREDARVLTNDFTIPHGNRWYQLLPSPRLVLRPKDEVIIRTAPDGAVSLWVREKPVNFRQIEKGRGFLASYRNLANRTFLIPANPEISISR